MMDNDVLVGSRHFGASCYFGMHSTFGPRPALAGLRVLPCHSTPQGSTPSSSSAKSRPSRFAACLAVRHGLACQGSDSYGLTAFRV
jgi:hypothetical protein